MERASTGFFQTDPLPTLDSRTNDELCSLFVQGEHHVSCRRRRSRSARFHQPVSRHDCRLGPGPGRTLGPRGDASASSACAWMSVSSVSVSKRCVRVRVPLAFVFAVPTARHTRLPAGIHVPSPPIPDGTWMASEAGACPAPSHDGGSRKGRRPKTGDKQALAPQRRGQMAVRASFQLPIGRARWH